MKKFIHVLLLTLVSLCTAACSQKSAPPETAASIRASENLTSETIAWREADMVSALAAAKEQGKPVFAYWGAEWCPYCNLLQATVFRREEFIALSHQFIAVDMSNGDSETIRSSDQYGIRGLPTVIIFSPQGEEITRIAGGTNMEQYATLLDSALNEIRPVAELVASVRAGETLSADDWHLLSAYTWRHDPGKALGAEAAVDVVQSLYEACPVGEQPVVCSRLGMAALATWFGTDEEQRPDRAGQYTAMVEGLLADPELSQANLGALAGMGKSIVEMVEPAQQAAFQERLMALYVAAIDDPDTYLLRRINYLDGWVEVAGALLPEEDSLPAEQVSWVSNQADAAMAALNSYQVQSGINTLWGIYYSVGLEDRAREALQYGIEKGKAPYYFMSGMAYIEQKADNVPASLEWRRKAWEATRLPIDRIRWGRGYLRRLLEQTPENSAEVERVVAALISDILAFDDGVELYTKTLEGLNESLEEWSAGDDNRLMVVAALREQVDAACTSLPESEAAATFCHDFLRIAEQDSQSLEDSSSPIS